MSSFPHKRDSMPPRCDRQANRQFAQFMQISYNERCKHVYHVCTGNWKAQGVRSLDEGNCGSFAVPLIADKGPMLNAF